METSAELPSVVKGIQQAKDSHIEMITRRILQGDKTVLTIKEGGREEKDEYDHDREESKEVATNLTSLKRQHDQAKASVKEKLSIIEKLKHEEKMLLEQDQLAELENELHSMKEGEIRTKIENTKLDFAYESINKKCYQHMIERMKKELLQMKIETNKLEDGIKKRIALLENEKLEYNRVKVEKYRAQFGLDQITRNVEEDQKKTQAKVELLTKQINEKTEAVARRIQRLQHRQYIKEAARSDQTDQNENKLRNQVLVHKFWNAFLRRKMEREIQNNSEISEAFEKIRTSTGLEDFQEIVKKFLGRENTYSQLLEAVTDAEKHREKAKQDNEKIANELQAKRIELDGLLGKDEESEVYKLKKEIDSFSKEEQSLLEKYQRCSIVYDQLRSWVLKIYRVLLTVLERGGDKHQAELQKLRTISLDNTEKLFIDMCGVIESLVGTYGNIPESVVTIKALAVQDEFYNDEVYKMKNIRVRPTTKPSLKRDESFRSSQGVPTGSSVSPAQAALTVEAEKDQKEINSEFRDERKTKRTEIKKHVVEMKGKKREERKASMQTKPVSMMDPFGLSQLEMGKTTPAPKF